MSAYDLNLLFSHLTLEYMNVSSDLSFSFSHQSNKPPPADCSPRNKYLGKNLTHWPPRASFELPIYRVLESRPSMRIIRSSLYGVCYPRVMQLFRELNRSTSSFRTFNTNPLGHFPGQRIPKPPPPHHHPSHPHSHTYLSEMKFRH